jgi:hypothetical protein
LLAAAAASNPRRFMTWLIVVSGCRSLTQDNGRPPLRCPWRCPDAP